MSELTERLINPRPDPALEKILRSFLAEVHEILPQEWKNNEGRIPFKFYSPILEKFSEPGFCGVYSALLDHSTKEERGECVIYCLNRR